MNLSDTEIDWFARQIVIPGVGASGQRKLLNATVAVCGNPVAVQTATSYAESSGLTVVDIGQAAKTSYLVCAGLNEIDDETISRITARTAPLIWYTISGSLLRGGVLAPGQSLPNSDRIAALDALPAEHRVAASDAIGTAVCLVLDWPVADTFEVSLA